MAGDRTAAASGIARLMDWAHGVRFADIPAPAVARMARIIADDLAAAVAARDETEVVAFHRRTLAQVDTPEATVFRGGRQRTGRKAAAVANGMAFDWLELDEGYRKASCHGGLCTLPALLAEAEADNVPLPEVLRAAVVAYEMVTRVARAWTPADTAHHPHARYAALGAAAATALVRKVDRAVLGRAFTGAATLINAGPMNHAVEGALVRNVWTGACAWSGMMSVEWAQCGIGGLDTSAYDVYSELLHGTCMPDQLTADLGHSWAVLDGYTKIHACCQYTHSAVEATLALRSRLRSEAPGAAVEAIRVQTHPLAMSLANYRPPTTLAAKFSLPHVVAAVLEQGEAGVEAFTAASIADAAVCGLRNKVTIEAYGRELPPPNDRPARVTATLADGRSYSEECLSAPGGPDQPIADAIVWAKIERLSATVYPRLAETLRQVGRQEPARMAQGWADVVADLCAPA